VPNPGGGLSVSDRAALTAFRLWGHCDDPRFWSVFRDGWRETLFDAWEASRTSDLEKEPDRLAFEHASQARPDLSRIHPTWWVRALKDEAPSVRRAVVANVPPIVRDPLLRGLGMSIDELGGERAPSAEAVDVVLALWTERFLGDLAERDDDPPIVVALTRFSLRQVSRLVHAAGLVKWALARSDSPPGLRNRDRERFAHFRTTLAESSPKLRQLATHDVEKHGHTGRHQEGRLGQLTVARLLESVDPYRVRWTMQHLPYKIAKLTRSLMHPRPHRVSSLTAWETKVLEAAWNRLHAEGRLNEPFGVVP
jgi:hypothetical protein